MILCSAIFCASFSVFEHRASPITHTTNATRQLTERPFAVVQPAWTTPPASSQHITGADGAEHIDEDEEKLPPMPNDDLPSLPSIVIRPPSDSDDGEEKQENAFSIQANASANEEEDEDADVDGMDDVDDTEEVHPRCAQSTELILTVQVSLS